MQMRSTLGPALAHIGDVVATVDGLPNLVYRRRRVQMHVCVRQTLIVLDVDDQPTRTLVAKNIGDRTRRERLDVRTNATLLRDQVDAAVRRTGAIVAGVRRTEVEIRLTFIRRGKHGSTDA